MNDGIIINVFQGSFGGNPDLDIIVKYKDLRYSKRIRTPKYFHWVIDILVKKQHKEELTKKFIVYLKDMWDKVQPFRTKEEQQRYELKLTSLERLKEFGELDLYGEFSVEFIGHVIELFMIEEKTSLAGAFIFKDLFDALYEGRDFFSVVSLATYKGR